MDAAVYNRKWPEWTDFIRYNPGARHRRRLTLKLIADAPFKTVLDVGCGNAELLSLLAAKYPDASLQGADFSAEIVKRNRKCLPGIPFHVLDIEAGCVQQQFDIVICCEVIEHLGDRRKGLTHLKGMARPGGYVAITCPTGPVYETERYFGHTTHPTIDEIREHARALDLEIVKLWNWGWPTYSAMKWATNVNSEWALRKFASGRYSAWSKSVSNALYWANFVNLSGRLPESMGCQLFVLLKAPE